jgi:hypothetical protein
LTGSANGRSICGFRVYDTPQPLYGAVASTDPHTGVFYFDHMNKTEKEGYYFPHYSMARNDRKVRRLRKELGVEGYGIFMMLLEILRDQPDLRYPMSDIDLLEVEIGTSQAKIEAVIKGYELFTIHTDFFFSPKLIEYLEPYFKAREQRSLAGQKSGESRRLKALSTTNDERLLNGRSTVVEQVEESRVKESKTEEKNVQRKRFTEPTFDEVKLEMGNDHEAQKFLAFYGAKGWMIGKDKMKDWRKAVAGWKLRNNIQPSALGATATSPTWKPKLDENGRRIYD